MELLDVQSTLREFELERYNIHNLLIKVLRVAQYRLDIEVIIFLRLNKTSDLTEEIVGKLYTELKPFALKKGFSIKEYQELFNDIYKNKYEKYRTTNWYDLNSKKVEENYIVGLSVSELTDYLSHLEDVLEKNIIPDGLHSLDLYYANEKKQKTDAIYLNHIGSTKSILNKIRDYLIDYLVNIESEIHKSRELELMDTKEQLELLIQEGIKVKQKNQQTGSYGITFISGAEYVTWIEKCKIFIKKNVSDPEIQENFITSAKRANGNGESYFNELIGILKALKVYDFNEAIKNVVNKVDNKIEKIFISHSSKDIDYVYALVKLLNSIGIKKSQKQIFCSSLTGYDIPYGANIYDYLKMELNNNNSMVLFVLSDNYYDSPPCLNEMGAAWITSKEHNSILTPNFDFKKIAGAIDPTKISFKMNDVDGINKFRDTMIKIFELDEIDYKIWDRDRLEFSQEVDAIAKLEALTLNTQVKLEKVKKINDTKLELYLRFINISDKEIEFKFIDINLEDTSGNKLKLSVDEEFLNEFKLYSMENKIIKLPFEHDPIYLARRDDSNLSKVSFQVY
ncbi:toll/interleukin-1 receptor domain-containing protein [Peribacillus psychrosaccharolyticus]|uniref:Toll/interleukin-1 receptor domain-containing protein n=2 Tax=Peribacillus psychrosaccharolyticus TaxID=1407 RepID=A0A974NLR8_PERPY|nr:toll/interleukin-1 receptor domain-containing protein [Peribacillus psychrosaccharolyticus]MEC2054267.1 toll/interleukin-1 receptor domain-containing protein [Peribacillus psychrosaccharolyticus]MED3744505.1 toll/interleukin-1 receptor domain-containing protein [Peribacillus psychrosaccharolyticus]QQS99969.1 toll/interleukin-1 receptor domain-containing protein [Peribacillus psychrosaccharolyticus]